MGNETPHWSPTMHPLSTCCLAPCLWSTNYYHVWPRTWQLPTCVLRRTTRQFLYASTTGVSIRFLGECVRGVCGPVLDIIPACRTRRFCGRLSTTSCDCDHNGHSQY
jgi:hypothetical protein